ncbi:replicative DNA helicase [Roseospira visakhapatnamensis]|uniref:Replicative DNA helicase n=1 Tax=Roseospira visakhapatnamensis TaxID=390880 RepID=A0A7W6R9Z9_9PROT|nr:replicative DNA helicase [Roseospira visakhapatnamensis]MBB4264654.1 replicative DNA helicase [Roseospira visakhapatnamensis]
MEPHTPHARAPAHANDGAPDANNTGLRPPPASLEAEQAFLGALLTNNKVMETVGEFLRPEHFIHPAHAHIYDTCQRLIERNQVANPVTVKPYVDSDESLAEVGGARYLAALVGSVVSIINAKDYGRLIHDYFLRRQLIALGTDMVNEAHDNDIDINATDQIETSEQRLYDLATTGQYEGGLVAFKTALINALDLAEAAHRREGRLAGVTTGLMDLDRKLGGLHASDLLILAGRPSMGKTALATAIAFNAAQHLADSDDEAEHGKGVAFFSLEMSAEQLATRILSERVRVSSHRIRTGELSGEDFERMLVESQELHRVPLYIDDTPALTVSAMRTRCRRLARQHGLGLVVVDYLQLLSGGKNVSLDSRVQEVSAITRGLKSLAKELNVPVLALSQLSRAVEQREDKRPQLADLRESGSIEQDADVVMFVFREQYYLERGEPARRGEENEDKYLERHQKWVERCEAAHNVAECIIAKQRHGPIGTVRLFFDGNYTRFDNLETGDAPEGVDF